jgi:hypothetical protein
MASDTVGMAQLVPNPKVDAIAPFSPIIDYLLIW